MALFFLLVGLKIKREMLDGELSSWSRRILPGAAALGGMIFPALFYVGFNWENPAALRGWAIPTATDIAFALGILSLFGPRVPAWLMIFLAALAIIDDLGAVVVIALFYTSKLNLLALAAAAIVLGVLYGLNRSRVVMLWPYIALGAVLWLLVFLSGIHATLAGVLIALTIPLKVTPGTPEATHQESPLHHLEHLLHKPVALVVVPIFGFANPGRLLRRCLSRHLVRAGNRAALKPDCCPLLHFKFVPPFPHPKLDRAQTDDHSLLAGQLLSDHIGIAVVPKEAFAQPVIQAIESSAANRLFEWHRSTLPHRRTVLRAQPSS